MAGKKGQKAKDEGKELATGAEVDTGAQGEVVEGKSPKNEPAKAQTFPNNCWIYSKDEEPRILKAGDPMPKGFTRDFSTVKGIWTHDATGKWKKA